MKTTLRNNTIETLQVQPEWKLFVDTLVESTNTLFDDNLITEVTEAGNVKVLKKLSDLQTEEAAKYATMSYPDDRMHLNLRENISVKGLLRTLSLYGCRIMDVDLETVLPHTYKVEGNKKSDIYGFDRDDKSYDHPTRAKNPTLSELNDEYEQGNVEGDYYEYLTDKNFEEEDTSYKYIHNIYGYNQKNPVISTSSMVEVKEYYKFKRKDSVSETVAKYGYVYISLDNMNVNNGSYVLNNLSYYYGIESNDRAAGVKQVKYDGAVPFETFLSVNYDFTDTVEEKWVRSFADEFNSETAYIVNNYDKTDLFFEGRIKYNSSEKALKKYSNVSMAQSDKADLIKCDLAYINTIGDETKPDKSTERDYFVYEDSYFGKKWIVKDSVTRWERSSIWTRANQMYADECNLKSQPLFVYEDGRISTCANFTDVQGGVGEVSFELDYQNLNEVVSSDSASPTKMDNVTTNPDKLVVRSVYYGDTFYKWEQYNLNNLYKDTYYTKHNYDIDDENYDNLYESYFFQKDKRNTYETATYPSLFKSTKVIKENEERIMRNMKYMNTFQREFIETMYFNHFIKVYPIVPTETDDAVNTKTLYCDNLELVVYGKITPYIVSVERTGESDGEGGMLNLDCAVFSKILSYNKNSHLITVNNPVLFENSHTPKYVVVAYQNASPFNKTKALYITAPNLSIKNIVNDIIDDYRISDCKFNLFTENEYADYVEDVRMDAVRRENDMTVNNLIHQLRVRTNENTLLIGTYDMQADRDNTPIKLKIIQKRGMYPVAETYTVTLTKNSGYFYLTITDNKLIEQSCLPDTNPDGVPISFNDLFSLNSIVSGNKIVTSLYFSDRLNDKNNTMLGDNLFSGLTRLKVIDNFKPKGFVGTSDKLFAGDEFRGNANLLYINQDLLRGDKTTYEDSLVYVNPIQIFKGTSLRRVNLGDIDWGGYENSLIDINLDGLFDGCSYLEDVNFKLKNGNRFRVVSMRNMFRKCKFLKSIDLSDLDLSMVTDATSAFEGCVNLQEITADWGNNIVLTNTARMFKDCERLKNIGNINGWKPQGLLIATNMFRNSGLEMIEWKGNITLSESAKMFDNNHTVSLNVSLNVSKSTPLDMPKLESIVSVGNMTAAVNWSSYPTPVHYTLKTPLLSVDSLYVFVSKQTVGEGLLLLDVDKKLFDRLKLDTDIIYDNVNDTYTLVKYPYVAVGIIE